MKKTMTITLHSIDGVKDFVNMISKIDCDATISSGRYIIDAKSIMGIFSLNLSKNVTLEIEEWKDEYTEMLAPYMAE